MTYLLDSDWIISFLNGRAAAVDLVGELADEGIAVSVISCGDVYEGLLSISSPQQRRSEFDEFASSVQILGLDLDVARQYSQIRSELRAAGLLIPNNDTWIAATARAGDHTLVSRDEHFMRVPGMKTWQPAG
jgi:tRNA(fMet)-specific endonuclease VapC